MSNIINNLMQGFRIFNSRVIITLAEFLRNPAGKKSSYGAKREEIKINLINRYNKLLAKEKKHAFKYEVYRDNDDYLFHFKIPSETYEDLYYDTVLQFRPHIDEVKELRSIEEYSLNFFSNSPHMMFTYTYVLNQNNLIVDFLRLTKCSRTALGTRPRVTNPVETFGFEKTCYFAGLFIKNNKLFNKNNLNSRAIVMTPEIKVQMLNVIKSQDEKFAEYLSLKNSGAKKKNSKRMNREKKKQLVNDVRNALQKKGTTISK